MPGKRLRKSEPPYDDLPWTEEQWEKMMRESDLRADRFGEILETVIDHPDRDKIVAREMGWDDFADELEEFDRAKAAGEIDQEEIDRCWDEAVNDPEIIAEMDESERQLKALPAYQITMRTTEAVHKALKPLHKGSRKLSEDEQELVGRAFIGIAIAGAKLSGGHSMGYDDDALCGNIVNIRRGLAGARDSIAAFEDLRDQKLMPKKKAENLLRQLKEAEAAIEARIAELRARVWWDKPKQ